MVRPILFHVTQNFSFSFSSIPLAIGLFVSVTLVVSLCAKHARKVREKYLPETSEANTPRSPLKSTKQLISTINEKTIKPLMHHGKKPLGQKKEEVELKEESGVWQKAIMMGDKCRPPEFSGVIYYDYSGNRIPEMPKSPRTGPMSPFRNFTFQLEKDDHSYSTSNHV